jgi:hypothetical protein
MSNLLISNFVPALNANAIMLKMPSLQNGEVYGGCRFDRRFTTFSRRTGVLGWAMERSTHLQDWRNRAIRASETLAPSARDVSTTRASTSAIVSYHVFRSRVRIVS